jgi:hypothetical protein
MKLKMNNIHVYIITNEDLRIRLLGVIVTHERLKINFS